MSTLEYVIVALVVGTLAVVLWQVISIRRLAGLLDRVRDSQCEQEYRACKRECEKLVQRRSTVESPFDVLDDAIGQVGWDPGWDPCERERFKAQIACYGIPGSDEPDPAAREECLREAERRFQECLAKHNPAYAACMRRCLEKRIDCHRKILQDATLERREELPGKPEPPLEPPIPPIGPRP